MTPREIMGCLFFAVRRKKREAAMMIGSIQTSRGKPSEVKKAIEKLTNDR
jgi:hypothetical protein